MKRIVVTGAAGQIAYSLLFLIAQGNLFGLDQQIALHLLDLPGMEKALEGVAMELEDCAFSLLKEIRVDTDPYRAFQGVHNAFLVGAKPRGPGMERKDLIAENAKIFVEQGKALNRVADREVRVLVVGNPCNTNCLIALHHAPELSPSQFFSMTRLDENRAKAQLAKKMDCNVSDITQITIWGNHSTTQVPDFFHARIKGSLVAEQDSDQKWQEELMSKIQKRGAEVIALRGKSSAASAAHAAIESMRALYIPTPQGNWFSAGIYSRGNPYGIDENLVFSFPCRSEGAGDLQLVPSLSIESLKEKILLTQNELQEERAAIAHLLKHT